MADLVECDMCKRVWSVPRSGEAWRIGFQSIEGKQLCHDCRRKVLKFIVAHTVESKHWEAADADADAS